MLLTRTMVDPVFAGCCVPGAGSVCAEPPPPPAAAPSSNNLPFTAVQRDEMAVAGSLANAWGDFDNDGDVDLAVSLGTGEVRLYRNDNGALVSVGASVGMPQAGSHELRGLSWGDFDGDGFLDLLGGSTPTDKPTIVLRNDGGTKFTDVAAVDRPDHPRPLRPPDQLDRLRQRRRPGRVCRRPAGREQAVPQRPRPLHAGLRRRRSHRRASDGWRVLARYGQRRRSRPLPCQSVGRHRCACGATTARRSSTWRPTLGMAGPPRTKDEGGVGCAIGDYDNDGDFDIFAPNYGHNLLYRNDGHGTFTEVGKAVGVGVENHAVGADWGDYDNDGDLDLSVISYEGAARQPDAAERAVPQRWRGGVRQRADQGQPAERRRPRRAVRRLRPRRRAGPDGDRRLRPGGRPFRVQEYAARRRSRSAAWPSSCSMRRAMPPASARRSGCSIASGDDSSPRARWPPAAATTPRARRRSTSAWRRFSRCAWT